MKYVRTFATLATLFALCTSAAAQWQTPNHSVPIGRGAGVTGFGSALGATGQALFGVTGADPVFRVPSFADLVGNISVNQMAGGVGAAANTFWRGDGTWSIVSGSFDTLAAAQAASVPAGVNVVTTLGRNTAGDNGGASYTRVPPTTAAAWRFQSADGQWWALNNRIVTPEMFGAVGDGVVDNTAVFQSIASWLQLSGVVGATVNFYPNANYKIWPAGGATPNFLMLMSGLHGVTFNFNGGRFVTDNTFAVQAQPRVFQISSSSNLTFNDPSYTQTGYTLPLDFTRGGFFFTFTGSVGIHFNRLKQTGGISSVLFSGDGVTTTSQGITLLDADITNVYYGMNFAYEGDGFFASGVNCNNVGRCYFPYGVSQHDVSIISNGGPSAHDNVLLKQYAQPTSSVERNTLSDITVRYRNTGQTAANNLPTLVSLEMQQIVAPMVVSGAANNGSGKVRLTVGSTANAATGQTWFFNAVGGTVEANGRNVVTVIDATHLDLLAVNFVNAYTSGGSGRVPAGMKNINISFDVNDITGNGQPPAVITRKYTYDTLADTGVNGYLLENIGVSGTLKNYNSGVPVFNMFTNTSLPGPIGTWTGETLRNIRLHDLTVSGSNSSAVIDATNLTSLQLQNIWSTPTTVPWTVTGDVGTNIRRMNVSATNLADAVAIIPTGGATHQFVTGVNSSGGTLLAQPSSADLSDGNTGTGAVVHATSPAITTPTGIVKGDVGLGNVANIDTTNASNISSGTLAAARGGTDGTAWTTYTPTIGCGTGSFTTATAAGRYKQIGKTVFVSILITITTNGTCAAYITATLPVTDNNTTMNQVLFGREAQGTAVLANMSAGVTFIKKYDTTYPGVSGGSIVLEGVYEPN